MLRLDSTLFREIAVIHAKILPKLLHGQIRSREMKNSLKTLVSNYVWFFKIGPIISDIQAF